MNAWQSLIGMLKVYTENIKVLHHNLVGKEWFATHEKLSEYYEMLDSINDDLIEIGISQGVQEITIKEAIVNHAVLEVAPRGKKESYGIVKNYFEDIEKLMALIAKAVDEQYIGDKLRTYQEKLSKESKYKLAKAIVEDGE